MQTIIDSSTVNTFCQKYSMHSLLYAIILIHSPGKTAQGGIYLWHQMQIRVGGFPCSRDLENNNNIKRPYKLFAPLTP